MLERILDKFLYGGNPKKIFLLDNQNRKFHRIFDNKLMYEDALEISKKLMKHFDIKDKRRLRTKGQLNNLIFAYCLTFCEMNGLTYKADKMLVVSELSRSLSLGCLATVILNGMVICFCDISEAFSKFLFLEGLGLIVIAIIFMMRKKRYEKYRIRILLRAYSIYCSENHIK